MRTRATDMRPSPVCSRCEPVLSQSLYTGNARKERGMTLAELIEFTEALRDSRLTLKELAECYDLIATVLNKEEK